MNKKLYIGNLSFNMDEQSLTNLFAQHGTVESARIVTDRETGRSRGFGFVEMQSDAEAATAIEKLNGTQQFQREMSVSIAKPMAPKENNNRGGFNKGSRY